MTAREFCYWIQGFFELESAELPLTTKQVQCIKAHLALVFKHEIDGSYPNKQELQSIHDTFKPNSGSNTPFDGLIKC